MTPFQVRAPKGFPVARWQRWEVQSCGETFGLKLATVIDRGRVGAKSGGGLRQWFGTVTDHSAVSFDADEENSGNALKYVTTGCGTETTPCREPPETR